MKTELESTSRLVEVSLAQGTTTTARVWQGKTEGGVPFVALVLRVAVASDQDQQAFQAALQETAEPQRDAVNAFPLRMVI